MPKVQPCRKLTPSQKKSLFFQSSSHPHLCAVESSGGVVHAPVVLDSPVLDGLPHLLNVAWCLGLLLVLDTLSLEADLGGWCSGGGARGSSARLALGVEDSVGLVHVLVVLLDRLPGLGDVALRVLRLLGGGGGVAGANWSAAAGHAWGVGCLVGCVEAVVVGLCVGGDVGEDVGWHCGSVCLL